LRHAKDHINKRHAVYLLLAAEGARPRVYIGSTNDAWERIKVHFGNLKWWKTAVALTSKTEPALSLDAINWLERRGIQMANETGRYQVENAYKRDELPISVGEQASLTYVFDNLRILVSVLGYPVFEREEVAKPKGVSGLSGVSYGTAATMTAIKGLLAGGVAYSAEEIAAKLSKSISTAKTNLTYMARANSPIGVVNLVKRADGKYHLQE
jgi:hypothetical protein